MIEIKELIELKSLISFIEQDVHYEKASKCIEAVDKQYQEMNDLGLERLERHVKTIKKLEDLQNKIHHFVATIDINDLIPDFDTNCSVEEIFNQIIEALNKENKDLIRC